MKLIVCGGRDYHDHDKMISILDGIHKRNKINLIIEGGCRGADAHAATWADANGINRITCHANWHYHRAKAGPIRNKLMLSLDPDGVVAFGGGKGTGNMIQLAKNKQVKVYEVDR